MKLDIAIRLVENELLAESKRAARLKRAHSEDLSWKVNHYNAGFWAGEKVGIEIAIGKIQKIRRLIQC